MDDQEMSLDSPADDFTAVQSPDKQRASLQTYLDSLPYECESVDEMRAHLERIVGKLIICAESRNWLVMTTWDAMLQCWLLMRYPMPKSTRAKLVRLYYELCLVPGIEARVTRSWADMLSRLLSNKAGSRRKLEATDLQLPWKPLWRVLRNELWPKKRLHDSSRNVVNILLYVAEQCKRYFSDDDINEMLSTFLPLFTADTHLTMTPVLTSFLPPACPHFYMPVLFKIWEAFNSFVMDDRLLEMVGNLCEEHVAGKSGIAGEKGGAVWKDIGIWSEEEWTMLVSKGLASMNVPVGKTRGASTTSVQADASVGQDIKIKKNISRQSAIAKLFVYSMAVDGPVRIDSETVSAQGPSNPRSGYLAGSKALESLDRFITSTETFFHPSNSGPWTVILTNLFHCLTLEFSKRWHEEEQRDCKTPVTHRLTPAIRRQFVKTLQTPALLAMFSKDPLSLGYAQGALRNLALLEPGLIMPELLERAYGGLEVVNETHRTTAVLSMLSGITLPMVTEKIWRGGQKHVAPLLELCIPGIDLNDPVKTVCATTFIASVLQYIKIGDLSMHHSGHALSGYAPGEDVTDFDGDIVLPEGVDSGQFPVLSREEERTLVRESTAGFADWVTSLFRRILALYENLPEEGGKKNTTGGKQEETALKSIKSMLNVVCSHLSDQLFDLVLKLTFDYATTNAKSNAVRAFGQLIACLARAKPQQTIDKFLPFCISQIQEELKHGASSIRTTSTHDTVPSDTTLHWNITILRGCLGYGSHTLLKHKEEIIGLLVLLVEKAKSERGYSETGHLVTRMLYTLAGIYPLNVRFVNDEEWKSEDLDNNHNASWGKLYEAKDVKIEWHVPSDQEVQFVLDILNRIASPALDKIDVLLDVPGQWDGVARNDFCRYLNVVKSIWSGLPTFYKESLKDISHPCLDSDIELEEMIVERLDVKAGFTLTDPQDPRYRIVVDNRNRFGNVIHRAATILRQSHEGEDHIDAVIIVVKAIDTFFLDYGMTRGDFDKLQKNYSQARDLSRTWSRQKENARMAWVKRAQVYHSGRVYMHALYRRRSELDDKLLSIDLVEFCLSPYTRVRRLAQVALHGVCGYYMRSTRFILPSLLQALTKGNDPDRMKGALYVLNNKGTATYALSDQTFHGRYLLSLLECQHEEKAIQNMVRTVSKDCLANLTEEVVRTAAYTDEMPGVQAASRALQEEFSTTVVDVALQSKAVALIPVRAARRGEAYNSTIHSILQIATRPTTHWRYTQMAMQFLSGLLRRDTVTLPQVANFFMKHVISPQPVIRATAQQAVVKLATFIKFRTYAKSSDELWLREWQNPLSRQYHITNPSKFLESTRQPIGQGGSELYFDKISTGFLAWSTSIKGYVKQGKSSISWEKQSEPTLRALISTVDRDFYLKLALLWGQEFTKAGNTKELRTENINFVKTIAKMFEDNKLDDLLTILEPMLWNSDRFQQNAAAEILAGLLRGSKHWPKSKLDYLWSWIVSRLDRIYAQIKPDTLVFWEHFLTSTLEDRDPRRNQPLVDWIFALPLEFHGDSAFSMNKALLVVTMLIETMGVRFNSVSDRYASLFFDNANTSYAEIRTVLANALRAVMIHQWRPSYPSVDALLHACKTMKDPLHIRDNLYGKHVNETVQKLSKYKGERLPPPRVNQSEYDTISLTMLLWVWISSHGPQACLVFPSAISMLPEILKMLELNDNSELQKYATGVLYVLSAVHLPSEYVGAVLEALVSSIKDSTSWRIRLNALPALVVFFYRNLLTTSSDDVSRVMDLLLDCLSDENVEVREMSSQVLSGIVRCSQRQSITPLKNRFVSMARKVKLPARTQPQYAEKLRSLHSAILGICALIESFPYSVESWMPPLTEILAVHATDPPPISTTIRKCASEFKKTHQDTWHKDQLQFDEDQLQSLSTMLVGTSYYA
ncbi:hypothetical protein SERLA73DRAFT_102663 [Serpula lacrymans var. lacrymans S7.3]|uniref:ARM repeat-containing protein n=1 Tax=Serpula lacrymans var. lacrymans (strain S7.3) TaxID=936435 RepID=F8PMA3_SERL3|nr:hypothetical protein SERLA73DRAFT_102663 [Serpula lacrymans var. lacrymans S7.3]